MSLEHCEPCNFDGFCQKQKYPGHVRQCIINKGNREDSIMKNKNPKIEPVKQPYKVLVKYTGEKEVIVMFFNEPVEIHYNFICGTVTVDTIVPDEEDSKCLFITHYALIDYCQVSVDLPVAEPLFLTKDMNITSKGGLDDI